MATEKEKEMDGALTEKGDLKNGSSNSHSVFLSSLSYSDSEMELEIELEGGEWINMTVAIWKEGVCSMMYMMTDVIYRWL